MSYDEYRNNAEHDLSRALSELAGDEQHAAVAGAQVWATLALAEAIREGFASLRRQQRSRRSCTAGLWLVVNSTLPTFWMAKMSLVSSSRRDLARRRWLHPGSRFLVNG